MGESLAVQLGTAIRSVDLVGGADTPAAVDETASWRAELEAARSQAAQAMALVDDMAARWQAFAAEQVGSHREQIARLSVAIAEKILRKEIQSGQYDVKRIVEETLHQAPTCEKIRVRLHPGDRERLGPASGPDGSVLRNVELVADPHLGPAECAVETDQVTVEYVIADYLRRIEEALTAGGGP